MVDQSRKFKVSNSVHLNVPDDDRQLAVNGLIATAAITQRVIEQAY